MNECLTTPQHKNKSAIGCQRRLYWPAHSLARAHAELFNALLRRLPHCPVAGEICERLEVDGRVLDTAHGVGHEGAMAS